MDSPGDGCLHLAGVIDGPDTNLLACGTAVADKLLAFLTHEHSEAHREAFASLPEVLAGELGRHTDVVAAEAR